MNARGQVVMTQIQRSQWKNRLGFILAAAGSAVGLGNIWRFPYMVGENGGSIFIIVYLLCVLLLGLPIMIAEITLGKITQRNPVGAFKVLAGERSPWQMVGFSGVLAAFVILSYYSVVAGWCLDFIWKSLTGVFQPGHTMAEVTSIFQQLTANPRAQTFFHGLFMVMVVVIVLAGVQRGLQRWNEILMPALIFILLVLIAFSMRQSGANQGLQFILRPDPSKLTGHSLLAAMGQCFFSLSIGMGAMLTYGSYLRKQQRVPPATGWVVGMDTGIALLAGFVVFPVVFTFGQQPQQGPGLVFVTLPAAFLQMQGGTAIALAFFILLLFAALTSAISMLEVVTAYFTDEFNMTRRLAALMSGTVCFLMGTGCAYSGAYLDFLDTLASNYLLPLGALFISLFVGYKVNKELTRGEFRGTWYAGLFGVWHLCIRVIAPALVIVVFLNSIGILDKLLSK